MTIHPRKEITLNAKGLDTSTEHGKKKKKNAYNRFFPPELFLRMTWKFLPKSSASLSCNSSREENSGVFLFERVNVEGARIPDRSIIVWFFFLFFFFSFVTEKPVGLITYESSTTG